MVTDAVMVGAGQRGFFVYGAYANNYPDDLRFVAVVDPNPARRERFVASHPEAVPYADVSAWLDGPRTATAAIVANPDRFHHAAAIGALDAGYHVLLEKPMAATVGDVVDLVRSGAATGRTFAVAHVLRYTSFFTTVHDVIASGELGEIVTVEHRENISAFHMAHSFVRGNWSRVADATPMIVQKCCHDFDVLAWNLPSPVATLSSVGSLFHFRPENAPAGATARCVDPCPVEACPFDARNYLNLQWQGWPVHVITHDMSQEGRTKALRDGPWGRCVYTARSDVVDHQIVTMQLESGASAVLVMHGHSAEEGRTMRYDGTKATLRARFGRQPSIQVTDHVGGAPKEIPIPVADSDHGGGDHGVIRAFLAALRTSTAPLTSAAESLESHLLAFAAEEARVSGEVLDMSRYRRDAGL